MDAQLDLKRIGIFLAFAFGIAWLAGMVVYLTGGMASVIGVPGIRAGLSTTPLTNLAHTGSSSRS